MGSVVKQVVSIAAFAVNPVLGLVVTAGFSVYDNQQAKKKAAEEAKKFKTAFTYFLIALIVLIAGIPWPFRNLGAAWF